MMGLEQCRSRKIKAKSLLLILIFLGFVLNKRGAYGQQKPPTNIGGFSYQNRPYRNSHSIMIEALSALTAGPLGHLSNKLADFYSSRLSLVVHLFPLPYHDNAFAVSRAVNMGNASATLPMLEEFFKHQERFYHYERRHLSKASIVDKILNFTTGILGNSYHNVLKSGVQRDDTDSETKLSFKYGASRGVYGTPSFFLNGF